jgi:hypothetical protein
MPNEIHQKPITAVVWADTTDYAGDVGTRTHQIDLTSIAAAAARQGAKADLAVSGANLGSLYAMYAAIEMDVAAASGELVDFYLGFSPSGTAGTANPGGLTGADAAYTGTAGDSLADSLLQLQHVGSMVLTADIATVVQFQFIGYFVAPERYASLAVVNNASQAFEGDAVEMGVRVVPYVSEVQ